MSIISNILVVTLASGLALPAPAHAAARPPQSTHQPSDKAPRTSPTKETIESSAARYIIKQDRKTQDWLVWKTPSRLEIQRQGAAVGMAFDRLANDRVERWEIFHNYRTVVRYQPVDNLLHGSAAATDQVMDLMDGRFLQGLSFIAEGDYQGQHASHYQGQQGNLRYDVLWLDRWGLPASVRISHPGGEQSMVLAARYPLADSPLPHIDWFNQYDDLDYADLGDNETHPLVKSMHHAERFSFPGAQGGHRHQ